MSRIKLTLFKVNLYVVAMWLVVLGLPIPTNTQSNNLISNPQVEVASTSNPALPQDWLTDKYGTNTAVFTYPVTGYQTGKGLKVELKKRTSGDAKWYFKEVPITANKNYIFSDYYISNIKSYLVLATKLTTGKYSYTDLATLNPATAWTSVSINFKTPANAASMTVYHLIKNVGYLNTDNFSLYPVETVTPTPTVIPTNTPTPTIMPTATPTLVPTIIPTMTPTPTVMPTATPTLVPTIIPTMTPTPTVMPTATPTVMPTPTPITGNIVANWSLETQATGNTGIPDKWSSEKWGTNTTTFTYLKNSGYDGSRSVKVQTTAYTSGDAKWYFNPVTVNPGESYRFSDWYQSNINTQVVVMFTNTDGSESYLGLRDAAISAAWNQYSETFTVPAGAKLMTVFHLIQAVGWLTTDDYSLEKYSSVGYNRAMVSLTFDDGWEDNTLTALPLLKEKGIFGTFYFATTYLSSSPATGAINVSGPSAVKTIYADGHEIGSHSVTHPDLTTLTVAQLNTELADSKSYLEGLVGSGKIRNFASPFGAYNTEVNNAIASLYRSHRTTDEGYNTSENFDTKRLKVQNMLTTTTLTEFKSWVDQAIADKSWLILVYHRIATTGLTTYDTNQADFVNQINYLKSSGVTIKTVDQALDEIGGVIPTVTPTSVPTTIPTMTPTLTPTATPTLEPTPTPLPIYPTPTSFPTPTPGPNLIPNPSMETIDSGTTLPQSWLTGAYGTNSAVFSYPVAGVDGEKAVRVDINQFTNGDAKWYFTNVTVEPNKTYNFSDKYQSNVATRIAVQMLHDDSSYTYLDITNPAASTDWATASGSVTIPADVHTITVFHLIEQVGFLITDNFSLNKTAELTGFNQGMITLSFDDGWSSVFQNAIPILNSAGFKSTQYLVNGFLDKVTDGYVTTTQALEMQSQGHEIGGHSETHASLSALTEAQIRTEVTQSRTNLLNNGLSPINSFAYPFGEYNDLVLKVTKESGFTTARTAIINDAGFNYKNSDPFLLRNNSIEVNTTFDQVRTIIDAAIANKTWAILVFHQVDSSGGQYSVTPAMIQSIVDYLKQTGVSVVTISQGLNQMLN